MAILLSILSWISSSAFSALATGVISVINKKTDASVSINATDVGAGKEVDLAQISANVAAMHEQAALATLRWGWWGSRWLMVAASAPAIWHYGQVLLDSCRWVPAIIAPWYVPYPWIIEHDVGTWKVAALPGPYQGSEMAVIATVVGILTVQSIGGGIVAAITKKK